MPLKRPCEFQPIKYADTDSNFTLTNEADPESAATEFSWRGVSFAHHPNLQFYFILLRFKLNIKREKIKFYLKSFGVPASLLDLPSLEFLIKSDRLLKSFPWHTYYFERNTDIYAEF